MAEQLAAALGGVTLGGDAEDGDNNNNNNNNALASPPPPELAETIAPALPLAIVFDALLEQKILDAVDVCELGCVCSELALCVRQFWAKAEAHRGSQRRLLFVADDRRPGEEGLVGASPGWSMAYKGGLRIRTWALYRVDCSCCGSRYGSHNPFSYVFPYFDDAGPGKDSLFLCRNCYGFAQSTRAPPPHSREARFRLMDWDKLLEMYDAPALPRSILACSAKAIRSLRKKSKQFLWHETPHSCVRRVSNFALLSKTPRELQARWREVGGQ